MNAILPVIPFAVAIGLIVAWVLFEGNGID